MGGEWAEISLGDVIELKRGYDLPRRERRAGPFPIVSSSGISGHHAEAKAKSPGVVIGRYGTLGEVHYITDDYWPLNTALYVRNFKGNHPRFISYFLRSLDFTAYSDKAAVPGLNRNDLHTAEVILPPLPEQRAIAHILGTLDDKIELNRRMNETLETMARALFKSWFVDFDPVRAKAEGRDTGLPKHLADLFPDSLEDSELGEIPKGWGVGRFGDVAVQLRDKENPLLSPDVLYHHFSLPAFDDGQSPRTELGGCIKSLKSRVPAGAILLSKLNPEIERVWFVDVRLSERAVCSTEFLVLQSRSPFTRNFVYCLARSPLFRQQVEGLVTGTSKSHQRAHADSILGLPVVLPTSSILAVFDLTANCLLNRTLDCRRETVALAALRDSLLPKLISGELRIKDAEQFIKEATA